MATRLGGLGDKYVPGLTLTMPIGELADGKEQDFVIPLASAELGAWCHLAAQAAGAVRGLSESSSDAEIRAAVERVERIPVGDDELTMPQRTLGTAYQEMATAGVLDPFITYAGATAFAWILAGEEKAAEFWNSGGELGKAGNRAERRAQERADTRSTRTDGVGSTLSPDNTSGTTTRKKSRRRGKGGASRGTRS